MVKEFTLEEMYVIERFCDQASGTYSRELRDATEKFLLAKACVDVPEKHKKLLFEQIEEWAESLAYLSSIRNKCKLARIKK